jgi:hypothetical protein|tara:strand:- start:10893 stop:11024 length:132 start_codon:yes stop_codon:yes gene_type:complete
MDGLHSLRTVEGLEDSFDEQGRKARALLPPQRRAAEIEVFEDD